MNVTKSKFYKDKHHAITLRTQSITNITDKKKWVINMSSRQLTHIENDVLAKSLNFSITSKTLPNKDIIATIQ